MLQYKWAIAVIKSGFLTEYSIFLNKIELIQQLKKGNNTAFTFLVQTYQHMVFNTVLSIVQQYQEAEDVAQDVFVQAFLCIHQFRGDSKISTWLYRIAITKSLDHERKKNSKKRFNLIKNVLGIETQEQQIVDFYHPGIITDNKEKAAILFKAMKNLPNQQRIAFTLIKIEGLNYEEVATILKVSIKALESLMHRAKNNLRKQLTHYYNNNSNTL